MTKQEMQALINAQMASGNAPEVKQIEEGEGKLTGGCFMRGGVIVDPLIKDCTCGCLGNWTDHTMRLGENGQRASW